MTDAIKWRRCERCSGAGKLEGGLIPGELFTCSTCGGIGRLPEGGDGCAWFIRLRKRKDDQRVAVLMRDLVDPKEWRISHYDERGVMGHSSGPADRVMGELRGYRSCATAAKWLDFWSTREPWKEGIKTHHYLAYWNLFSFKGRYDLCREMDAARAEGGINAAIAVAAKLKRQHLPEDELY